MIIRIKVGQMSSKKKEEETKEDTKAVKEQPKPNEKKETKKKKEEKKKEEVVREMRVDLWRTRFHGEKIGIRQDAQHRHEKGFQWSKDMEPLGEVKEDGKQTRLLGLRKVLWEPEEGESFNEKYERRLIIKSFTKSAWVATVEELTSQEIKNSVATGKELPAFMCLLSGIGHTVSVEQMKSVYGRTFAFTVETKNREFEALRLRERRFSFGSDWDVFRAGPMTERIANVDGKFMNVGGAWDIKFFDSELAKNKALTETLILFAATLRFHKEIRQKIDDTVKAIENGDYRLRIEKQEYDLLRNPRIRRV